MKSGRGTATIEGERHPLRPGDLVLIEAGEPHEIANDGDEPLETVTVYALPTTDPSRLAS